ncbi:MAG: aldehyde dehydrogenase family protein [Intrasporangiaceae bacterium]|nr:aldehyde dehydrogenase family protein [Intrasporangiaceae bacterium]
MTTSVPPDTERHGSVPIPEPDVRIPETAVGDLDAALATLRAQAQAWTATGIAERIDLLDELLETTLDAAPAWTAAAAAAKGIDQASTLTGEDWISGPSLVLRNLALLRRTLTQIQETGAPQPPSLDEVDGQVRVGVMPADLLDRLLFTGFSAEVRLQPGVTAAEARDRMGRIYRSGYTADPAVALVLGAGNVSSIGPMDGLYQLFALDRVVLLKMNPVNEHLGPHIGEAFAPLVRAGVLRIVYGGGQVGAYLTDHEEVDAIHITGSDKTYEAIVFGSGEAGVNARQRGEVRSSVPVTAELGNVTPVIVVPGPWSDRDLAFHGENIASMLTNNAGFNCIASRVIVQHRAWAKRHALLDEVRDSLRRAEPRSPYYPGAHERWRSFTDTYAHAERFGPDGDGEVPFTLIPELEPDPDDDLAFTTEAFCGVMAEVALDAPRSIPEYLEAAVSLCNERLWGTLAATIIVHPASLKDPLIAEAVEQAIDALHYGSVVVNHNPGAAYAFVAPSWGAYPGATPDDIQSGVGVVHNSYLLEDVQKSVVRGPFRPPTKPVWFHTHRRMHRVGPRLAEAFATGAPRALVGLARDALRG